MKEFTDSGRYKLFHTCAVGDGRGIYGISVASFKGTNQYLPALKAPADASPGQRPGFRHQPIVWRPEGAHGPSALSGRTKWPGGDFPRALLRAGILRAVGAMPSRTFKGREPPRGNFEIGPR
jgi:hypothetical protein